MRNTRWVLVGAVVGLLSMGCGGCNRGGGGSGDDDDQPPNQTGGQDGSSVVTGDGGAELDGAVVTDAAAPTDGAPAPVDAATAPVDGGGKTDAASSRDGAAPADAATVLEDAGLRPDSGSSAMDSGHVEDAGHSVVDAGEIPDGAGPFPDAASQDAGGNTPPRILEIRASSNPFVNQTELTVVVEDPDGDAVQCLVQSALPAVTFMPVGWVPGCVVQVTEQDVPRQTLTLDVQARDARGGTAQTTYELVVGNHNPTVTAVGFPEVLPGESVTLSAPIHDPDVQAPGNDSLSYAWVLKVELEPGISVTGLDTAAPQVHVDRSVYQGGRCKNCLTLKVYVTDDTGASADEYVDVSIADERGGYVDNTSPYSGTGPRGYCGVRAHPCNTIQDALTNLAALSGISGAQRDLRVATTGQDYVLDQPILLDRSMEMRCGFNRETWDETEARTPLRFTGAYGVMLRADATVVGCDVEGVALATGTVLPERAAVALENTGGTLRNNRLVGTLVAGSATRVYGVKASHPTDATGNLTVDNNDIHGGVGVELAAGVETTGLALTASGNTILGGSAASCIGLRTTGSTLAQSVVSANTMTGGTGVPSTAQPKTTATGVVVDSALVILEDNPGITGGTASETTIGVLVAVDVPSTVVRRNTVLGTAPGGSIPVSSRGMQIKGNTTLADNVITSGPSKSYAFGVHVNKDDGDPSRQWPVWFERDSISGGESHSSWGVFLSNGSSASFTDVAIVGTSSPVTMLATGLYATYVSELNVVGGSIRSGRAFYETYGISGGGTTSTVIEGVSIEAEDVSSLAAGNTVGFRAFSYGLHIRSSPGGQPTTITAGAARTESCGLYLLGGSVKPAHPYLIEDTIIHAGKSDRSTGIQVVGVWEIQMARNTVTAGEATASWSVALDVDGTERENGTKVTLDGDGLTAGTAATESHGLRLLHGSLVATNVNALGGLAGTPMDPNRPVSSGVYLTDLDDVVITGGTFRGNSTTAKEWSHSNGLYVEDWNRANVRITGVTAEGWTSQHGSFGMQVMGLFGDLRVSNCTFLAGDAGNSAGVWFHAGDGDARLERLWFSQNNVVTGNSTSSHDVAGVHMYATCGDCVISRNIIQGGAGSESVQVSSGFHLSTWSDISRPNKWLLVNNRIMAGEGKESCGLRVIANAGMEFLALHNNIHGGGLPGGKSAAVCYRTITTGNSSSGIWGGNVLDRGVGSESYGFREQCQAASPTASWNEPIRAINTDFWPPVDPGNPNNGYVLDAVVSGASCTYRNLNTMALVNENTASNPYRGDATTGYSWDADPRFEADGFHIRADSPLRQKAYTQSYWQATGQRLEDFDGEDRPNPGSFLDIGMDEVPF